MNYNRVLSANDSELKKINKKHKVVQKLVAIKY